MTYLTIENNIIKFSRRCSMFTKYIILNCLRSYSQCQTPRLLSNRVENDVWFQIYFAKTKKPTKKLINLMQFISFFEVYFKNIHSLRLK